MTALVIKLLLAVFAFVTAVLSVSDLKTVRPQEEYVVPPPWWRRVTIIGLVKIGFAAGTLLLLAAGEYLSYRANIDTAQKSDNQTRELQDHMAEAKAAAAANVREISRLARANKNLIAALDTSLVRAGTSRISDRRIDSQVNLNFETGEEFVPKRADQIEWTFICANGRLPELPGAGQNGDCADIGYGALGANADRIRLRSMTGKQTYFGTRSTGEQMFYEPVDSSRCPRTSSAIAEARCSLEITVMREARWKFRDLQQRSEDQTRVEIPEEAEDACRRYQALYGERCEDVVAPRK